MARRMTDHLAVVDGEIRCMRCDHSLCAADQNYKLWALQERGPVTDVPRAGSPEHDVVEELETRRYYCPGCVTQLDVEISLPELPPLHDVELDVS